MLRFSPQIDDYSPCLQNYHGEANPFCMENIDVSNFLNLHSLGNHEDFCLAYVFTYRDFTGGTLGLAWVASASGWYQCRWIRSVGDHRRNFSLWLIRSLWGHMREVQAVHGNNRRFVPVDEEKSQHRNHHFRQLQHESPAEGVPTDSGPWNRP